MCTYKINPMVPTFRFLYQVRPEPHIFAVLDQLVNQLEFLLVTD